MRSIVNEIKQLSNLSDAELMSFSKNNGAPYMLVEQVSKTSVLPVPNFSAGGIATPADAALMMHLGAEAVFVGSGIFKSENPSERAKSIVKAVTHYNDPKILADVSEGLKAAMKGLDISEIPKEQKFQERGW